VEIRVSEGKGTQTFNYDTSIDPRGLATSLADSAAGTFTARYDPDGNLVTQGNPNGFEERCRPSSPVQARSHIRLHPL
jgi:hypothetical protein